MNMKKRIIAYCLIIVELIIQILGGLYYSQTPEIVWSLGNAIIVLVPLAFGIRLGMLCLLPVAVSEIVWFCKLNAIGPLLHLASFTVVAVILGLAYKKLMPVKHHWRVITSSILYEVFLLGEEALYSGLNMLFRHRAMSWSAVSGTFLSPVNPLLLLILVYCCMDGRGQEGRIGEWSKENEHEA